MWIQSRSGVTAVLAAGRPTTAGVSRPAAGGSSSAPAAMNRLIDPTSRRIDAPASATAPRVTTAVLPAAGR
ncbi:hypothetical protein [Streptomyces platensis]|uniref:hypothetical protein n=1 Tax=Streptomyces platensis TaxID=58346 RepID=UPI00378DBF24